MAMVKKLDLNRHPMAGKAVKFAIGSKEQLLNSNKVFQKVELYIDGESGVLYIVPQEENDFLSPILDNELKISSYLS